CVTDVVPTYSVGGNVSGLTGNGLQLQNNGADPLAVAADGPFTFAMALSDGSAYAVTVSSQPAGQTCSVSNGSGTITMANVTNVAVTCVTDVVPTYSVGGNVSGLTGNGLQLQNNGADSLAVAADGPFTFATALSDGSAYAVTVSSQPTDQTCSVSNGSGTITMANVTNVAVTCVDEVVTTYSVGGNVSGLTGTGLQLQNNGADPLAVAADGPFTFAIELTDGSAYAVTVSSQPTGQSCTVSNGSGTIATADVTNVAVTCVADVVTTHSVGGNVSGLTGPRLIMRNNGKDRLVVYADGPFTFATELSDGSVYAVTVSSQPTGQNCTVSNGSGTIATADVTNVAVTCVDGVPIPPPNSNTSIPTLSTWALVVLSMLLGLMAFLNRRRLF
ncbi:IPTL-CTERM sorting domain-containing protein, partial [Pseudomonadota bacterium]